MTQLIAALIEMCARLLFPSRGRHTAPPAAPTIPVTIPAVTREWQPKTLYRAAEVDPDEGAFVRRYYLAAEAQGERRRQAERRRILAEAIGVPVTDWTRTTTRTGNDWARAARAAGIAA